MAESLADFAIKVFFDVDGKSADDAHKKIEKTADGMRTLFQTASFNSITSAIGLVFDTIKGGIEGFNHAMEQASNLGELSAAVGASTEQLQFWGFAAEQAGGSAEGIQANMKFLGRTLNEAASGSADAASGFEALHVSIRDAGGGFKTTGAVFEESLNALLKIEGGTKRNAAAQQIFGRSWLDISKVLAGGTEEIKKLRKEFDELGIALGPDEIKRAKDYGDTIKKLGATWQTFKVRVLGPVAEGLDGVINKMLKWYSVNREMISSSMSSAFEGLLGVLNSLYHIGIEPLIAGAIEVYEQWNSFINKLGPWGGLVDTFGKLVAVAFKYPRAAFAVGLGLVMEDIYKFFTGDGPTAIGYFVENWDIEMGKLRANNTLGWMADLFDGIYATVRAIVTGIRGIAYIAVTGDIGTGWAARAMAAVDEMDADNKRKVMRENPSLPAAAGGMVLPPVDANGNVIDASSEVSITINESKNPRETAKEIKQMLDDHHDSKVREAHGARVKATR